MSEKTIINADNAYHTAEQRAKAYFNSLSVQHADQSYIQALIKDFEIWKQDHVQRRSLFSTLSNKKQQDDYKFLQSLKMTGKLDPYLDRSISYIFMRDMGHALDSPATQKRIQRVVDRLKKQLTRKKSDQDDMFSMTKLYRMAEKNGIESTFIWITEKLNRVTDNIPAGMDAEEAQRKLIKIIAGLVMQAVEEMGDDITQEEKSSKLEQAIRLGYAYGLTYPFIDDLLDSNVLSADEKNRYSQLIRVTLVTGVVPPLGEWTGKNGKHMRFIHSELKAAFELIQESLPAEDWEAFLEQAFVFYQSQEVERVKDLENDTYTNEELYIPVILKSAASRLIVRSIIDASVDEGIDQRTFYYGIYNQLADDFTDMADDRQGGRVTPYTYYLEHHEKRKDLINPFELYWTVIANFIHNVYDSEPQAREVILSRAINSLKRFKAKKGEQKYAQVMGLLFSGIPSLQQTVDDLVQHATDVEFFDKLIRDRMIRNLRQDREEEDVFVTQARRVREDLNASLPISQAEENVLIDEPMMEAANYSLGSTGKRLRPIITWFMGIEEYGLDKQAIQPLLKSLEYMHTASLIYDDLPAQDNADFRRGNPTLHRAYNTATAELTGLYLTQQAVAEQASLESFDAKTVLHLIHYSANVTADMCRGQAMDLQTKGEQLTLEQLNEMCFYKTGLGFEAALMMPAILAGASESQKQALKQFARHAGIAFQIKDDLLDVEGDPTTLGKSPFRDKENNNSTFVSVLGIEAAKKEMWEHYCLAMETLQALNHKNPFLKHVLNYFVHRGY
ncbi:polyprenyl synthetase family protein [Oceanobacillus polygoni]|uniref:Geranylgeranyl pyrophosphate synthase n=1 Tax=Oceanobacillus polygoni TaxID=1235259 RepID=A0A9X0YWI4_9BACI|nr:polyprenyl synthetase family protein [Oceanobacillus polygoni]MBP2078419.1 geranylgeranyl pyrophosphate synthase [Oceanobacillus polygoni]